MSTNPKIKISQQEINDIYEITKEEPFPKVHLSEPMNISNEEINIPELTKEEWEQKLDTECGAISEEEYNENKNEEKEL